MTYNPYPPVPRGALQDLLGLTRLLYRSAREAEPRDEARLERLAGVGSTLREALRLSRGAAPGTINHGTAHAAALRAIGELTELVGQELNLAPVLAATARCFKPPGSMV